MDDAIARKRILVVEDESIIAMHLRRTLSRLGFNVIASTDDGEEAVDLAGVLDPDVVLMDIRLDGSSIDGIDAAREIRQHRSVPVVFLTAYTDDSTLARVAETARTGFTRLLVKPFDPQNLKSALENAVS